jgi:hypothetical protein
MLGNTLVKLMTNIAQKYRHTHSYIHNKSVFLFIVQKLLEKDNEETPT